MRANSLLIDRLQEAAILGDQLKARLVLTRYGVRVDWGDKLSRLVSYQDIEHGINNLLLAAIQPQDTDQ